MRNTRNWFLLMVITLQLSWLTPLMAQERGSITATVTDTAKSVLPGARVELQPKGVAVASNAQGQFSISDLAPGRYTLTVSYVGFKPFSSEITVVAGQT